MPDNPQDQPPDSARRPLALPNTGEKKDPHDPSLDLVRKPTVNRKMLRLGIVAFGAIVFVGVILGMQPHKPKPPEPKDKGKQSYTAETPSDLDVTQQDYMGLRPEQPAQNASLQPYTVSATRTPVANSNNSLPKYDSYARGPAQDQRAQYPNQQPGSQARPQQTATATPGQNQAQPTSSPLFSASFGNNPMDEETRRRLAALTSGFFFSWNSPASQQQAAAAKAASQQQADQQTQEQVAAVASAYESTYSKQNMQKEKEAFLNSQTADYSAYLDNHYLNPIDAAHLLQASTIIPITMITGINSDLPSKEIIAQVTENVFDSLSGQNILIPRGSRLIGTYDSNVSFGQNRVLIAWQRLIRTDGVSISLRGMEGADLQGKSGLHDQVDYHLASILAVVGASTAFNVATNAAIAAMSTNQFLSSLATAMNAQGSNSSNVTSAANAAATAYATKIIDQAPTIVIREGTAAYCLIDKDMILPAFVDQDGGYMPSR